MHILELLFGILFGAILGFLWALWLLFSLIGAFFTCIGSVFGASDCSFKLTGTLNIYTDHPNTEDYNWVVGLRIGLPIGFICNIYYSINYNVPQFYGKRAPLTPDEVADYERHKGTQFKPQKDFRAKKTTASSSPEKTMDDLEKEANETRKRAELAEKIAENQARERDAALKARMAREAKKHLDD